MKIKLQFLHARFGDIYGFHNERTKGRLIILLDSLLIAVINVFITGVFYTGFLTMYGMSITDTGILGFIPCIASLFCVFSAKILGRIKHRKRIYLIARTAFYALYCVVTTIMPQFVTSPEARMTCFILLLFLSYGSYALISPGITGWHYNFYPQDTERRTRFLTYNQIFSSVLSSIILLVSSALTDAVSNSPYQGMFILGFRYFAFVLVLFDVFILSRLKEYPSEEAAQSKLREMFTIPFRHKKFLYCMLLMFSWNFLCNINGGLWAYHLLNHLHYSYTLINAMTVCYTIILILFSSVWRKILYRFSWIKTFGLACLFVFPVEFCFSLLSPGQSYLYVILCLLSYLMNVGHNLSFANILYINLPPEHSTVCISFNAIGSNVFAVLGMLLGTYISSITNDSTMRLFGMDVYSVQFTPAIKSLLLLITGVILVTKWRSFSSDLEITDVERAKKEFRLRRELKKNKNRA